MDTLLRTRSTTNMDPEQLPRCSPGSRVALVTGANGGLGYYLTLHLYLHGWKVYMACRDAEKASKAQNEVMLEARERVKKTGQSDGSLGVLEQLHIDNSDLNSVDEAARLFLGQEQRLDLLVNNAGVMALPSQITKDGYDIQIQVSFISHYLLTRRLLPLITSTPASRVVFVSSIGHYFALPPVDLSKPYNYFPNILWTWVRYGNAKTANIHAALVLSKLYPNVLSLSVHPGFSLLTGLLQYWIQLPVLGGLFKIFFRIFTALFGVSAEHLAYAVIRASLDPSLTPERDNGSYLVTYGKESRPSRLARKYERAQRTWEWAEKELQSKGFQLD